MKTTLERFQEKYVVESDGCWRWTGAMNPGGYGMFHIPNTCKCTNAHRMAWMLLVGDIPPKMDLHHRCEHRWCVNPDHLELIDRRGHMIKTPKSRINHTHCPQGHPLVEGNLVLSRLKNGHRICLTCQRINGLAAAHRYLAKPGNREKSNAASAAARIKRLARESEATTLPLSEL